MTSVAENSQAKERPPEQEEKSETPTKKESFIDRLRSKPRLWKWLKRIAITSSVALVIGAAGVVYALYAMSIADKKHAAFSRTGGEIKSFLKGYANQLKASLKKKNTASLAAFYADTFDGSTRGSWRFSPAQALSSSNISHLKVSLDSPSDLSTVLDDWKQYFAGIEKIDHARMKISLIEQAEPDVRAVVAVKYVLDGHSVRNERFQDRFFFRWTIQKDSKAEHEWQIVKEELVDGVRTAGSGNAFESVAANEIGIDYRHRRDPKLDKNAPGIDLKFSVIEHSFGGVSAMDVLGNDGRPELLFLDGVESRFYQNISSHTDRTPKFIDVTAKVGLAGIDRAHTGLFFDIDNDGDKDLFVTRYQAGCKFFKNNDGTFVDSTHSYQLDVVQPCVSACLLDFDQDGFVDIYIGVNGDAHNEAPDIPFYAVNGKPNILLRNVDGKSFQDVSAKAGIGSTGWTLAVTAGDFNADGWPDLAVANDFGRKVLYRNEGNGTFTDCTKEAAVLDFSGGMGIAFGDLNGDKYPDLMTSNIESGQRWFGEEITLWQYMRNIVRTKWIFADLPEYRELYGLLGDNWRSLGLQIGRGNSVFINNQDETFEELVDCQAKRAGWAWSVNPFDHDADGDLDLYVSNGWISGPNPKAPDL